MIDYTSRVIVQLQKQYDMLMKSLKFTVDDIEIKNIYDELNRIEKDILKSTENIYNEKYNVLINQKTSLLKEEKERLINLIDLIENRRKYVNDELQKHTRYVPIDFEVPKILGQDQVIDFQKRIKIIDKYRQNMRLKDKLVKEIDTLKDSINKSEVKIRANERINKELETKMIETLDKSFNALEIYSYKEREREIDLAFNELTYAKDKALQNIEVAREANNTTLIVECEKMLDSVIGEYNRYFEKKMLLNLLEVYNKKVDNYDELLSKREKINDILSQIDSSDFYKLVFNEINKQYNTIKLEQQDLKTLDTLNSEKEAKEKLLKEIEEENSSDEFTLVLNDLIKNEKIKHDKEEQEKRKKEYEERQQRLIEESKKQEEIRKRQKIVEEARKRDIELRTKELLEAKQKTVIVPKNEVFLSEKEDTTTTRDKFVDKILNEMADLEPKTTIPKAVNVDSRMRVEPKATPEEVKEPKKEMPKVLPSNSPVNKYDSILQDTSTDLFKQDNVGVAIPVIKNDKLVSKKVDVAKVDEEEVDEFMKKFREDARKDGVLEVNDIVFPEMPM